MLQTDHRRDVAACQAWRRASGPQRIYLDCDTSGIPPAEHRWMSAAGSLANFVLAALCGLLLRVVDPASAELVLIAAAAASFGGTSALAWMSELLPMRLFPVVAGELRLEPSRDWLAAGTVSGGAFVAILGPGLTF